jgi:hypothetical protein
MTPRPLSAEAARLHRVLASYARPGAPPLPSLDTLSILLARPLATLAAAWSELEAAGLVTGRVAA